LGNFLAILAGEIFPQYFIVGRASQAKITIYGGTPENLPQDIGQF
jgi:hypothetical protein